AYFGGQFGTVHVGGLRGRLLTGWSAAGILGHVLVNYTREHVMERGVPAAQAYDVTMYLLAGLLLIGLVANLLVRPVDPRHAMSEEELAGEPRLPHTARGGAGR